MKLIRQTWDLLFGVLLVGVAPLCTLFLPVIISQFFTSFWHFQIPDGVGGVVIGICFFAAIAVFGLAIWWRTRHRITSGALVFVEIVVGIILGFFLLGWYSITEHFLLDQS